MRKLVEKLFHKGFVYVGPIRCDCSIFFEKLYLTR